MKKGYILDNTYQMGFKMRLLIGGFIHECNSFNKNINEIKDARGFLRGKEPLYGKNVIDFHKNKRTPLGGFIDVAERFGIELIPTLTFGFGASGIISNDAYNFFKEKLLNYVNNANNYDGVLLALHGSMVVEGLHNGDGEGEILKSIREIVGEDTPIFNVFDLHSTLTEMKFENSDAIFGYDTNPHVDHYERGVEAAENIIKTIKGKIKPTTAISRPGIIPPGIGCSTWSIRGNVLPEVPHLWDSTRMDAADRILPMAILFKMARLMEKDERVLNVSISSGFPFTDVRESGASITVVTNNDLPLAEELSEKVSNLMWNIRELFLRTDKLFPVDEAVKRAIKLDGPTILTDVSDDPGAGAVGDSTGILQSLVEQEAQHAALVIKDPETVKIANEVGIGATKDFSIGGKTDERCGKPVEISGKVITLSKGNYIASHPKRKGRLMDVGRLAVIRSDGIDIVVSEQRISPNDREMFRCVGIEPSNKKILGIKSTQEYRASFEPVVKNIILVDAPGISPANLNKIKDWYKNIKRPIFPLDEI